MTACMDVNVFGTGHAEFNKNVSRRHSARKCVLGRIGISWHSFYVTRSNEWYCIVTPSISTSDGRKGGRWEMEALCQK